jgi:hypothetical protein
VVLGLECANYEYLRILYRIEVDFLLQRDTWKTLVLGRIPNMMCFPTNHSTTQNNGFSSHSICENDI